MPILEFKSIISAITTTKELLHICKEGVSFYKKQRTKPEENICDRFITIFEKHGIHRNQIPSCLGGNLTVNDVKDNNSLIKVLDENILDTTCNLFGIRREWLDCIDDQIYPLYDFYKRPSEFKKFCEKLREDTNGVVLFPLKTNANDSFSPALIILWESIKLRKNIYIERAYLCNNWGYKYWKSRGYLTACIAMIWNRGIFLKGRRIDEHLIKKYEEGTEFLSPKATNYFMSYPAFHAENLVLKVNDYLHGIDPEQGNYGTISALKHWIKLNKEGFMNLDFNTKKTELSFTDELNKLLKKDGNTKII